MISNDFSLGQEFNKVFDHYPDFKFRDRDNLTRYASEAAKCHRQVAYKALGFGASNPPDLVGLLRMRFGQWLESGLGYDLLKKVSLFQRAVSVAGQGSAGEHDFYGTKWHGYRDFDLAIKDEGKWKHLIVELKTKVGIGATFTVKDAPWKVGYKKDILPDVDWGYAQQLSLYLRDAYLATKDKQAAPTVDGALVMLLFGDNGVVGFLEFFAEYKPETDSVVFYRRHCEAIPEISGSIHLEIKLKDIAERFAETNSYIEKGELPPPEFERRYDIKSDKVRYETTKTDLQKATKNQILIGDMQCKYCSHRDKCAEDLKIPLEYSKTEIATLKTYLKER